MYKRKENFPIFYSIRSVTKLRVDYRQLNKLSIKDNFLILLIEDYLDKLKNTSFDW